MIAQLRTVWVGKLFVSRTYPSTDSHQNFPERREAIAQIKASFLQPSSFRPQPAFRIRMSYKGTEAKLVLG